MRPSVDVPDATVYECGECGRRTSSPENGRCDCGGELVNLNRSRDL